MNKKNQTKEAVWKYTKIILGWGIFFYLGFTQKGFYIRGIIFYLIILFFFSMGVLIEKSKQPKTIFKLIEEMDDGQRKVATKALDLIEELKKENN